MESKEEDRIIIKEEYVAVDQDLNVFAGYDKGYPIWCEDISKAKLINNKRHLDALKKWFPNKLIEAIIL